jgi:hypothetical protein
VTAAAGTKVIQKDQENLMNAAWAQVGDVLAVNRKLRWSVFAREVSQTWFSRRVMSFALSDDRILRLTRPVHRRVLQGGKTIRFSVEKSHLTASFLSAVTTRVLRPGGRLMRQLAKTERFNRTQFILRANAGEIRAAFPKTTPPGLVTLETIGTKAIERAIKEKKIPPDSFKQAQAAAKLLNNAQAPIEAFDLLPRPERFAVIDPDFKGQDHEEPSPEEAKRLIAAARSWFDLIGASHAASLREQPVVADLPSIKTALLSGLDPLKTIRTRTLNTLDIPPRIIEGLQENFDEIMHHPIIDTPMYKPLEALSKEFLMPNLSLIPQNSITAVTTNQAFIEAYMVGLNHEFSRELLWREYPTDQRGTVFRQFWDVKSLVAPKGSIPDDFRESVRDIPKIHTWLKDSLLGKHDHRKKPIDNIVLVIRGELLKKYPNTVIYAHRAEWATTAGATDISKERELIEVSDDDLKKPESEKLRFPMFEAKIEPDIYLFGFDLTEKVAKGREEEPATKNNAGWFFVLKERPGEPRFGFDTSSDGAAKTINDFAWPDILPNGSARRFIDPAITFPILATLDPFEDKDKQLQQDEDKKILSAEKSAARWAYILYQAPMMVAIHAAELLNKNR